MGKKAYILTKDELRKLQLVLLEMLIEVDRICRKHNINYIISGGTLLGAVRHKGFIPWDDDIDIAILRKDYSKFRHVFLKELDPDRFFFQDHTVDPNYRWGYAKIRRKDSEFVRLGQEHFKMRTGIFLDVFPHDSVADNKVCCMFENAYCYVLRKILYSETGKFAGNNFFKKAVYTMVNKVPTDLVFKLLSALQNKLIKKNTKYIRTLTFSMPHGGGFGRLRSWNEDIIDIEFEGHFFLAPKKYHDYLKYYFGDYMQIPPVEKRAQHAVSAFRLPDRCSMYEYQKEHNQ